MGEPHQVGLVLGMPSLSFRAGDAMIGNQGAFCYIQEVMMQIGDIVKHTFLQTTYIVERLTPKKAEVRAILNDGLSDNINMILRRNLEPLTERGEILALGQAAFERRDWELKDKLMAYYYRLWPRIPAPKEDRRKGLGHSSGMYYGIRH